MNNKIARRYKSWKEGGNAWNWGFPFDLYHRWYMDWNDRKCATNPEWAEIEARRHEGDGRSVIFLSEEHNLGMDEYERQKEIDDALTERSFPHPYWWLRVPYRIHWWWGRNSPRMLKRRATWFYQRGKKGWSNRDTWGFDGYLARVIVGGVKELRKNLHGWPGEPLTYEEWEQILDEIVLGFESYLKMSDALYLKDHKEEEDRLMGNFERGFELLQKWFGHLWD